jgi:hypothetical protein
MVSTFTTNFGIEEMATGDQSGAWGTTTNFNFDILDRITSYKSVALSDAATATLTVRAASPSSGSSNVQDGMYRVIKFTGTLSQNCTITVAPNTTAAYFIFINATTDAGSSGPYTTIISQGSGANYTVANGTSALVYCDGAGSGAVVTAALVESLTTRGDIVVRNASNLTSRLAVGSANYILKTDGTDVSWGQVSLTAGVTGTLPIANGGTNSTSTTYCDLTANVTGELPTANIANNAVDETKLKDALIPDFTEVTVATGDSVIFGDATDSGNTKRDTVQGILDLAPQLSADQAWTGSQRGTPTTDNDGSFDMDAANNFNWTPSGTDTLEFTNETSGQGGMIYLSNGSGHTISLGSEIDADSDCASTLSEAGEYIIGYYCRDGTNVCVTYSADLA